MILKSSFANHQQNTYESEVVPVVDKKVPIDIDPQKERTLFFNIRAVAELERELGAGLLSVLQDEKLSASFNFLLNAFWAGLKHEERGLTKDRVAAMLDEYFDAREETALNALLLKVLDALTRSGMLGRAKELFPEHKDAAERGKEQSPDLPGEE
jgi:hypothetical protein